MSDAIFNIPHPANEPVLNYGPGSPEKMELKKALTELKAVQMEIPMYIGGKHVFTAEKAVMRPPHEISHTLGFHAKGSAGHVRDAINAALAAKPAWEAMPWQDRAAIFLKAADLLAGPYRARMNAATMLCQSKTAFQAEIDCVCELADFWRFNAWFMQEIYKQQPWSVRNTWNRLDWRPLEGFVFALTPFNFTSIAGNLPTAPAMLGNVVVWKPAESQVYSASLIMEILEEAGLPPGVINLVYIDGPTIGAEVFTHPDFAGIHYTGSTQVFQHLWKTIGENIHRYKTYPRIVGETGGKDFVVAHPSADPKAVAVALTRGAFEYQGQKCSAASRAYIPAGMWPVVKEALLSDLRDIKMGSPEDFTNFFNAVIDEKAYNKISSYIADAKQSDQVRIIAGGNYDKTKGYFIEPTVIESADPRYITMCEEIFGPVLTIYVYEDERFEDTLDLVNTSSPYALTGAVFARDRAAVALAEHKLRHAAGNFYINDKPTGAVVGQQPFGGARASGTNDKAGSILNLYRWVSPRTIKENFVSPVDYRYPFLRES
ncbi:MAG: L-glutamate gamma-semialdehyde dehydrogenase [Saprospirales bacterium]|jgi:1-pyrroline-5-carboxylate dehydrogenase|nr:L-glutamate gamma-semialdehyde dehydrogenase [Saprospirales bacterium]MBK8921346.1 L-glutamate gamma-semialdehyde dehydrogenase [Saprospirales bacterium]